MPISAARARSSTGERLPLTLRMLAGAWAANRSSAPIEAEARDHWTWLALKWIEERPRHVRVLGPDDFLRRTVLPTTVGQYIIARWAESGPAIVPLYTYALERGLFGDVNLLAQVALVLGADRATELSDDETDVAIRLLTGQHEFDAAEALYRERADRLDDGVRARAATAVIEGWEQAGLPRRAWAVVEQLLEQGGDKLYGRLDAATEIELRNEIGNTARLLKAYDFALYQYREALRRLPESPTAKKHEFMMTAHAGAVFLDKGQFRTALALFHELLDNFELSAFERADVLRSVGAALSAMGIDHVAAGVLELARSTLEPVAASFPAAALRIASELMRVHGALGSLPRAIELSRDVEQLARELADDIQVTEALVMRARAMRGQGDDGWEAAAADADSTLAQGGGARREIGTDALTRLALDLAALREDLAAAESIVAGLNRAGLPGLERLIATRGVTGRIGGSGAEIRRAWNAALSEMLSDELLAIADVDDLKALRRLRGWTAEWGPSTRPTAAHASYSQRPSSSPAFSPATSRGILRVGPTWSGCSTRGGSSRRRAATSRSCSPFRVSGGCESRSRGRTATRLSSSGTAFELDRIRDEVAAVTKRGHPRGDPLASAI